MRVWLAAVRRRPPLRPGRLLLALGGLCIAGLLTAAWLGSARTREPAVRGRPLTHWLRQYEASRIPGGDARALALRDQARAAVRELGTNAVPFLLALLRAHDTPACAPVAKVLHGLGLRGAPWEPAAARNAEGADGFEILRGGAAAATDALAGILDEGISVQSQVYAAESLGAIGPGAGAAVPALARALTNASPSVRLFGLAALNSVRAAPGVRVRALVKALGDPNAAVKRYAASELARCAREEGDCAAVLAALLEDADSKTREAASWALKRGRGLSHGEAGSPAAPDRDTTPRGSGGRAGAQDTRRKPMGPDLNI